MNSWTVVLGLCGEVLGVERGAPSGWLGTRLEARPDVPAALVAGARSVVEAARRDGTLAKIRLEVPELDAAIELVALPGVALRRALTDVRALLERAVAPLDAQARARDIALRVTIHPDVPRSLRIDPEKIAWALSALVGNALRYCRSGTRNMPGGTIAVRATVDDEGDNLVLVVEDDGPGIPAEVAARMFERTPGATHATGLALSVIRDIVRAHGGSLDVATSTDEADHGTTVTVRMPIG